MTTLNPLLNQFQDQIEVLIKQYNKAGLSVSDIVLTLEMAKTSLVLDEVTRREENHGSNN